MMLSIPLPECRARYGECNIFKEFAVGIHVKVQQYTRKYTEYIFVQFIRCEFNAPLYQS